MTDRSQTTQKLFESLQARLRTFILSRIADNDAVDDILQTVFLKIHSRIDSLRDETKIESWIFQITRNAIADHFRTRFSAHQEKPPIEPSEPPAEEDAMQRFSASVRDMIDQLPEHYREALLLTEFDGLTQQELAARAGISLSGAKSRVQRARQLLKDMLMQCCHVEFDKYGTVLDYYPRNCSCCSPESPSQQA
jgi:RNA polymerase sigma-70 factor (ECF subfamily)